MNPDQAHTLRKLSQGFVRPGSSGHRRIFGVTGGKGGVGKSTIAVNLAVSFARKGRRTLMLDGDFGMADLNLLLGVAPTKNLMDLVGGAAIDEVLTEIHGIYLIPGRNGSHFLANLSESRRNEVLQAVNSLGDRFDTLIIDTPAGIGESGVALAAEATWPLVVVTPEPLSLADAYACLKVLATRRNLQEAYIVPNNMRSEHQADETVGRLRAIVDRFLHIQLHVLPTVPYDPLVPEAAADGVPLVIRNPDSPAARAIRRIVQHLEALVHDEDPAGDGQLIDG